MQRGVDDGKASDCTVGYGGAAEGWEEEVGEEESGDDIDGYGCSSMECQWKIDIGSDAAEMYSLFSNVSNFVGHIPAFAITASSLSRSCALRAKAFTDS